MPSKGGDAARVLSITSASYVAAFLAIFLIAGAWPVQPLYEAIPAVVLGSIILGWLGTLRAQQIAMADKDSFAVASLVHGFIISVMIGAAIYVRITGVAW
jgi:hypothetical protein